MTDSCMYELDDNVWSEFGAKDCVVPFSYEKAISLEFRVSEINNTESDIYLTGAGAMLEISPWPGATNGGSPASGDTGSGKDLQILTSENSNMSNHGFNSSHIDVTENDFCTAELLLGDNSAAAHDTLFNYHIPQTENNLSFLKNECNDKECNDFFYGWSDIGNFEDVDKMLRSCDSPFGLESIDNEDICWFPSQPTEESEAATTDYSKLNQMLESHGASVLKNEDSVTNSESNHMFKDDPQSVVGSESVLEKVSADASDTSSLKKDTSMLDEQTNLNNKLTKEQHHLDGKRNRCSDNGRMLHQNDYFRQIIDTEHEYGTSTCECYPPSNEPYSSNKAQSLDSLHGHPVDTLSMIAFDKRTNMHQCRDTHPSFAANGRNGNKNMMVFSESVPVQKIGQENEDINDAAKSELSNVQESSFVSSGMDDISLEATSYRQLQQVIEQLDIRTKLCIRDSLYRLAKSAEHRHNCMNPEGGNRQDIDSGLHLVTGKSQKYAGFMDMETDTNPIDRSIAHLLFHRPSETEVLSFKPHPMIPQHISSPSLRVEKLEETSEVGTEIEVVAGDEK